MTKQSLDAILGGFDVERESANPQRHGDESITSRVGSNYKAKYNAVQSCTHRRFAKTLKEIIQTTIEQAYEKIVKDSPPPEL